MYDTPTDRDLDKRVTELEELISAIRPELERLLRLKEKKNGN